MASPPTAQPTSDMTERLELLLRELEAMTLELPEATVLAAWRRVAIFVASRRRRTAALDLALAMISCSRCSSVMMRVLRRAPGRRAQRRTTTG